MKGYVYLDIENNLVFKPAEYIEVQNPLFFSTNYGMIEKVWKIDTEDDNSIIDMLKHFSKYKLEPRKVEELISCIKYDLSRIRKK